MTKSFDVFLSHNSKDKPAVRELAEALLARGLKVWLDEWELVPGQPWQEALEEVIETTGASAVLVGKDGLGPWQDAEMRGCLSEFLERKLPVIPVLLPGASEVPKLPFFLKRFTWVDLREGLTKQGLDRLQWGITGRRTDRSEPPLIPTAALEAAAVAEGQSESAGVKLEPPEIKAPTTATKERINQRARALWPAWIASLTILGIAGFLWSPYLSTPGKPRTQRPTAVGSEEMVKLDRPVQDEAIVRPEADNQETGTPSSNKPKTQNAVPAPVPAATQTKPVVTTLAPCVSGKEREEAGFVFVRICPGTFTMGIAQDHPAAFGGEMPAHQVILSEFWIAKTETTNAQYRRFRSDRQGEATLPVTNVSWDEAKAACEYFGNRLPTEAEWEYAARAGSQAVWSFGDVEEMFDEYAWNANNADGTLHRVGTKRANTWGLYDMYGNVFEWVADWYSAYSGVAQTDPLGPATGEKRVLRGGSFFSLESFFATSARRAGREPNTRSTSIGFRCARNRQS